MENASEALIIAAGVLIGILIISLGVYLFVDFGATSADIHSQVAERQITQFNTRFTSYADKDLTIYNIITIANYAIENNKYYEGVEEYKVTVWLGNKDLTYNMDEKALIERDKALINENSPNLPVYRCKNEDIQYSKDGRIKSLRFVTK